MHENPGKAEDAGAHSQEKQRGVDEVAELVEIERQGFGHEPGTGEPHHQPAPHLDAADQTTGKDRERQGGGYDHGRKASSGRQNCTAMRP